MPRKLTLIDLRIVRQLNGRLSVPLTVNHEGTDEEKAIAFDAVMRAAAVIADHWSKEEQLRKFAAEWLKQEPAPA